jgi:phosphatidylinositol-3-phosphatase
VLNHPSFQAGGDGLMFVTFDECDGAAGGSCNGDTERVFTAVIGPNVKPGTKSTTSYKHESTLRTILDAFGITIYPGAAATTSEMKDFF